MGDPKKSKRKYSKPSHPWQKTRIEEEGVIVKEYCLKNKKELWKMQSILKDYSTRAKKLVASQSEEAKKEAVVFLKTIKRLKLIPEDGHLDNVLSLELKDLLERRLQTIVYRKGLARSMKQARQFIVHKHIMIKDKLCSVPSYLIEAEEEDKVKFIATSELSKEDHPERTPIEKKEKKPRPAPDRRRGRGRSDRR